MADKQINARGDSAQAAGRDIINFPTYNQSNIIFDPQEMADIINALYDSNVTDYDSLKDFCRPAIETKNALNQIDPDFFKDYIQEFYGYFHYIDDFFKDPNNHSYTEKYEHIIIEIRSSIAARQEHGESLQDILPSLFDYAKVNHQELFQRKSYWLTILAYYMYVNCDIGRRS